MGFEWDPVKAAANVHRHDISFTDACEAFRDPEAVTLPDDYPDEPRFLILGMDALARLVVVVYTIRGENARIISARKATRAESEDYGA